VFCAARGSSNSNAETLLVRHLSLSREVAYLDRPEVARSYPTKAHRRQQGSPLTSMFIQVNFLEIE